MARWVGSPTTGHWVDDNGNPTAAPNQKPAAPANTPYTSPSYGSDPFHGSGGGGGGNGGGGNDPFHSWTGGAQGGSAPTPGAPAHNWDWYAENELNEFGQQMSQGYEAWKKQSQSYYDPYSQWAQGVGAANPTQNQSVWSMYSNTPGPSRESDLYGRYKDAPGVGYSAGAYNDMRAAYQTGPNHGESAFFDEAPYYLSPTKTDSYADQMRDYGTHASDTSSRYRQRQGTEAPDYSAARYRARMNSAGPSNAADLLGSLKGDQKSAAEGLMFDPEHTQAIADLYNKVLLPQDAGPGYAEQWYTSTLNGDNPYYDRLADKTAQAAERRAAASGTFNAGRSQRMQGEALADLRAQQFKDQGALAAQADSSKEARLGTLTTGAKTFEDTVLGNRKYNLDVATQMDTQKLGLNKLRADLASSADTTALRHGEDIDTLSKSASDEYNRRQEAMDRLATDSDAAELNRRKGYTAYLDQQDTQSRLKKNDYLSAARQQDEANAQRQRDLASAANQASGEENKNRDYLRQLASGADATEDSNRRFVSDMADRASKEAGGNIDRQGAALLADAASRAGIDLNYNTMEAGTLTTAQLGKIQIELAKAGMDASERQALIGGFLDFLGKITGGVLSRPSTPTGGKTG